MFADLLREFSAYFEAGGMDVSAFERIHQFQDKERKLLLQALVGLTQADRDIGVGSRRVMVEQIKSAGLPREVRKDLLGLLKEPGSALAVAAVVEDDRTRDFLLEQVLLGAMLDGHFSEREWDYIENLAGWLGVPTGELAEREAERTFGLSRIRDRQPEVDLLQEVDIPGLDRDIEFHGR